MKKPINQILKEQFERAFNNARKQYEAESKQKPFGALVFMNPQGEPMHSIRICFN